MQMTQVFLAEEASFHWLCNYFLISGNVGITQERVNLVRLVSRLWRIKDCTFHGLRHQDSIGVLRYRLNDHSQQAHQIIGEISVVARH